MVFSDFGIPQSFIVENSKQSINFNTGCVTNMTFQEVDSNCIILKEALENSSKEFRSTCGSKDAAVRILKGQRFGNESFENNISL